MGNPNVPARDAHASKFEVMPTAQYEILTFALATLTQANLGQSNYKIRTLTKKSRGIDHR